MSDRPRMLGERVETRQKAQRVTANCTALKERLRALSSPTLSAADTDRDAILDTAVVLHAELGELQILAEKLAVLNRELGY